MSGQNHVLDGDGAAASVEAAARFGDPCFLDHRNFGLASDPGYAFGVAHEVLVSEGVLPNPERRPGK
jgi:hypothetical protein